MENSRRNFLKASGLLALSGVVSSSLAKTITKAADTNQALSAAAPNASAQSAGTAKTAAPAQTTAPAGQYTLPVLPYAYDALEPHIDKLTMEIHHDKHHKGYVDNLNKALKDSKELPPLDKLMATISTYPMAVRNNAGGHYNHSLFWQLMKPNGGGAPTGKLAESITKNFTSFDFFKTKFTEASMSRFGSGWTWLIATPDTGNGITLKICSTPNQDNPLMDLSEVKGKPVLALDVWEHAYYLKHQNKRAEYIEAWFNVINWDKANELFAS